MPSEKPATDRRRQARRASDHRSTDDGSRTLTEQIVGRALDPLAVVLLSRDRIQETLEDAVQRGRVTRSDANDLAGELVRKGRMQTDELLGELERLIEGGRERLDSGKRSVLSEGIDKLARTADLARRTVAGGFPIDDYDSLTSRQVQSRLGELGDTELRQVRDYEHQHGNRKTVLEAIERALD
jgi:polyhydroxyalkanoate synthesis regulator phasin